LDGAHLKTFANVRIAIAIYPVHTNAVIVNMEEGSSKQKRDDVERSTKKVDLIDLFKSKRSWWWKYPGRRMNPKHYNKDT